VCADWTGARGYGYGLAAGWGGVARGVCISVHLSYLHASKRVQVPFQVQVPVHVHVHASEAHKGGVGWSR
jgi:hypothetical protein